MKKEKYNIQYFIFDSELIQIAKENDLYRFELFMDKYPGQEELIEQAFTLLQNLKIKSVSVSQEQIEADYQRLLQEIKSRKRKKLPLWISVASVACACVIFVLTMVFRTPQFEIDNKTEMLSLLDSINKDVDEIQIVSGDTKTIVANNESISQTEEGHIIVGNEEKVKSEEIKTEFIQVVVPYGKRTNMKFSDGTVAWLNSGSKLVYPKVFAEEKRELFVEGEIYIEVKKNNKPFIVHAKKFDVAVLGTKFNINAYGEDAENSVVLIEGSVEVKADNEKIKLVPNQGLFSQNGELQVKSVDTYTYTAWKDGIMKVNGESLENMFKRLSRHYNMQIHCEDSFIAKERYRGKLDLQDSLEEVLYNLSLSTPFAFDKKEDNSIRIYLRNDLKK